jgi:hypothetical protein
MNKRILTTFILFASCCAVSCQHDSTDQKVFTFLKHAAENASKHCPVQVDSIIKLQNVTAFPPATLRYNYTLQFDTIKYDFNTFKRDFTVTTRNSVKSSPDAKMFRNLRTTFEYNYHDTLGNFLFRIVIKPTDYVN